MAAKDPRQWFIGRLQQLRTSAGRPSQATLLRYDKGRGLNKTTLSDLLKGKFTKSPPWERIQAYATACVQAAHARNINLDLESVLLRLRHDHDALTDQLEAGIPPVEAAEAPHPQQLTAAPAAFIGREPELTTLTSQLDAGMVDGGAVVISSLNGTGGIGKTWLALHWAHQNIDRFPDGQLFVDLHGFSPDGEPTTPEAAIHGFLDALGVESSRIPPDLDARAAMYRTLVAGKRMLIVLDNVATAEQAVPLLPGSPTCTVLVTGRHKLASLIDRYGARHLSLGVLTRDEARALLTVRLGVDRVADEPDAVDELIDLCGRYPLALAIIARNAATRPTVPLPEVAAELRDLGLEMLDHDIDPAASLPDVLSWSLRYLTDEQRTVFGLLGIAPGTDTTLHAVASLTALTPATARKAISALDEASLIERRPHGRYAMHDLVHEFAATTSYGLPDDIRKAAVLRALDFHLHTAHTADRLRDPRRPIVRPDPPMPGVSQHPLTNAAVATAWLKAEHATLMATQQAAAALGRHSIVWQLAWTLNPFLHQQGHVRDALATWQAALHAATHLTDLTIRTRAHRNLGQACSRLGLHDEAIDHLNRAIGLAISQGNTIEQAHVHLALAISWERRGNDHRALDHARHALAAYRMINQPWWEGNALNQVGWLVARTGNLGKARDYCHAALALHRQHDHPAGEADTLDSLGSIAYRIGDHQQAIDHYHQALNLRRILGHRYQVANTLDHLGDPHAALGQHPEAHTVWREALELYREQGRHDEEARVQRQLDNLDQGGNQGRLS